MKRELLASLLDAFNRLDDRAKSGDAINCSESIMIVMAIDAINHELAKPKPEPLTPQQWWDIAPWREIDGAPEIGVNVLTLEGGIASISFLCNNKIWRLSDNLNRMEDPDKWLPLPENK